jgi:hypothetical protein
MNTHPMRRRIRRRLLYGTTAVLCGMTIVSTTLSVVGYVRYQQLAAEERAATARALETESFITEMGLLTTHGDLLLNCELFCAVALKPSTETTGDAARSERLRLASESGHQCEIPIDYFRFTTFGGARTDCWNEVGYSAITSMGTSNRDGETRTTVVIGNMGPIDRIDFLDEANRLIFSAQVFVDAQGKYRLTASQTADDAAQAAWTAMRSFIVISGGALLAFFTMNALAWMAARGRFPPRRAPLRRGTAESGTWQQAPCDKAWADRVTMGLIASAVRALDHPDDQDRYHEEWAADADEISGKWYRLRWALLLRLCAPTGIRSARRSTLSMSPRQQR